MMSFELTAQLRGHNGDVRAVASWDTKNSTHILSASRDGTSRIWSKADDKKQWDFVELTGHQGYVNSCCWFKTSSGGVFAVTGGQDKMINAYRVNITSDGRADASRTPDYTLIGHEDNVSSLCWGCDDEGKNEYIVSGSWDKTAKVWKNWQCVATLKGHLQAVWAVLGVKEDLVLTASADKLIRSWSISKPTEPLAVYAGHTDAVRGLTLIPHGDLFASCSNDGTIKVWRYGKDVNGTQTSRWEQSHTNFVYSVASTGDMELVSAGEDRCVKYWGQDELYQSFPIPATSVWSVCGFEGKGFVCGSSDGVVRIFASGGGADQAEKESYERDVASQTLNSTQVGDVRKDQVPGKEALNAPGTSQGQTKMVSNNGVIEAYQWNDDQWQKIGEVVGGVGSGQKKLYQGREYDYVFDVDIADGVPPLKLPYNLNENAYVAAQRFIDKNELDQSYLEQIVQFIDKNTEGATLGAQGSTEGYVDPFSGSGRYIPGSSTAGSTTSATPKVEPNAKPELIPQTSLLLFQQTNLSALQAKVDELSGTHGAIDVSSIITSLSTPSSAAIDLSAVQQSVLSWPAAARFPLLDLLRITAAHPTNLDVSQYTDLLIQASEWTLPWPTDTNEAKNRERNTMLAARGIANLFEGQKSNLASGTSLPLDRVRTVDFAKFNKLTRTAYATVAYNCSTLLAASSSATPFSSSALLSLLIQILTEEPGESEVIYRALVALGNLLYASSANKAGSGVGQLAVGEIQLARDAAEAWGQKFKDEGRIQTVLADLKKIA